MAKDNELRAHGRIQSFNVEELSVAPGFPIKHVTVTDIGEVYLVTFSGFIGTTSDGALAGADTYAQAKQTLENVKTALLCTLKHLNVPVSNSDVFSYITFTRVDLTDLTQVSELNRAYIDAEMPYTGRAAVEVKRLPLNAAVEITVQAVLPKG